MGNALVVAPSGARDGCARWRRACWCARLQNLRSIDVGFDSHNILIFGIDPTLIGYKGPQVDSFYRDLQGRLSETPGVKSASYSMMPLLSNGLMITSFIGRGHHKIRIPRRTCSASGRISSRRCTFHFSSAARFNASDFELAASNDGDKSNFGANSSNCESGIRRKIPRQGKSARKAVRRSGGGRKRTGESRLRNRRRGARRKIQQLAARDSRHDVHAASTSGERPSSCARRLIRRPFFPRFAKSCRR